MFFFSVGLDFHCLFTPEYDGSNPHPPTSLTAQPRQPTSVSSFIMIQVLFQSC